MNQSEFKPFSTLLSNVADYYGRKLAPGAIQLYWNALAAFDFETVKRLLTEHVKASRFMPTIAEILDAIRALDGRPEPEEAWSMVARSLNDEGLTIVWTQEIAAAFGVALGLQEDRVAARMAFKEAYQVAVAESRRQGKATKWTVSLGHDAHGRETPILKAVAQGKLTAEHAAGLLPYRDQPSAQIAALLAPGTKLLTSAENRGMPAAVRDVLKNKGLLKGAPA